MEFSSTLFLLYFLPAFLVVYSLLGKQTSLKNWWILLASIGFYTWGAPEFVFILLISTVIDFYVVKQLYLAENQKRKRLLLILSLTMNLGLLAYFKYANFLLRISTTCFTRLEFIGWAGQKWSCQSGSHSILSKP
jgi:alginate O-acetyltransferase complex protein AlgI